ncbi:hypothetical protein BGW80DRAFT_1557057 [Lactifluus volemus]|nr:hypothetical protein BGW80DRAFT_1557057 [Lactifluus volemus]
MPAATCSGGPPYFTLGVRKAARPVFCTPIRSTHSRTGGYSARHRPQARKPKTPLPYFEPMYVCSALRPALEKTRLSSTNKTTLREIGIRFNRSLYLSQDKQSVIKAEGNADATASGSSFETTSQLIRFMRNNVALETTARGRPLTDVILLHLASTLQNQAWRVELIPEFPVGAAFKTKSSDRSFSGLVDYVLVRVPPGNFFEFLHRNPIEALSISQEIYAPVTSIIIGAKKNNLVGAIPHAAIMAASYCKQQEVSVLRGCITSGEQWMLFIYRSLDGLEKNSDIGEFQFTKQFSLGKDLHNLAFVVGVLGDMANNALNYNQKYFSYLPE